MHRKEFDVERFVEILDPPEEKKKETIEWMVDHTDVQEGSGAIRVLLLGAGQGRLEIPYVQELARRSGRSLKVTVVDYSEKSNEKLRNHLEDCNFAGAGDRWRKEGWDVSIELSIREEDFEAWVENGNGGAGHWDVIVTFFILSFLSDWMAGLKRILGLLKPGGSFFISQDAGDIRFIDNTFSPIDDDLKRQLTEADEAPSGRVLFYNFWRRYYQKRREEGYPWEPIVSPSDMSAVWNILHTLCSLSPSDTACHEALWSRSTLSWKTWLKVVRESPVFHCLYEIPDLLKNRLADDLKEQIEADVSDSIGGDSVSLDGSPEISLGHKVCRYRKPTDPGGQFQNVVEYVIEQEYAKKSVRSRAQHRPFRLGLDSEETRESSLKTHIRRLLDIHQSLPEKDSTAFGVVHWQLEDFSDPRRGSWTDHVPVFLPEVSSPKGGQDSRGGISESLEYFLTYAIYMCSRNIEKGENYELINEVILNRMPEKSTLNIKKSSEENVEVLSRKDSYISEIEIDLDKRKFDDIVQKTKEIVRGIDRDWLKNKIKEDGLLEDVGKYNIVPLDKITKVSDFIWKKDEGKVRRIFEMAKVEDGSRLKNELRDEIRFLQKTRREWGEVREDIFVDSLSWIYTNAIIGATGHKPWTSAFFVPSRSIRQVIPDRSDLPWESSVFGLIYYHHGKRFRTDGTPDSTTGGVLKDTIRVAVNQYGLEDTIKQYADLIRGEALESAVAAIMSRNMDHLLGSHIETAIMHQMPDLRRVAHSILNDYHSSYHLDSEPGDGYYADSFSYQSATEQQRDARSTLDHLVTFFEDEYADYRLRRMDLIARFATKWTTWGMGMSLLHQVIRPFMQNGLLLHYLGHGEGLGLRDIDIRVAYPTLSNGRDTGGGDEKLEMNPASVTVDDRRVPSYVTALGSMSEANGEGEDIELNSVTSDFVRIRGGDIGVHAFHILMENILRNSAKHQEIDTTSSDGPAVCLNVWPVQRNARGIFLEDDFFFDAAERDEPAEREDSRSFGDVVDQEAERSCFVLLSSSADVIEEGGGESTQSEEPIDRLVDGHLCKPLVKSSGEPDTEAWGMKEKKICASYLAGGGAQEANDTCPEYIWAGRTKYCNGKPRLAYCLKLPRANFLLDITPQVS